MKKTYTICVCIYTQNKYAHINIYVHVCIYTYIDPPTCHRTCHRVYNACMQRHNRAPMCRRAFRTTLCGISGIYIYIYEKCQKRDLYTWKKTYTVMKSSAHVPPRFLENILRDLKYIYTHIHIKIHKCIHEFEYTYIYIYTYIHIYIDVYI